MTQTHHVITQKQARQITGGRTPHMPVEYEAAVKALQACIDLDDAKYWSDKADALAAWAKIFRSKEAEVKAKQLKLRAYRRMGELAAELRPKRSLVKKGVQGMGGTAPGPVSLLREHGLSTAKAEIARKLARMPSGKFNSLSNSNNPPSLGDVRLRMGGPSTSAWLEFTRAPGSHIYGVRAFCRKTDAASLAKRMGADEVCKAKEISTEISEWFDAFEQALPKAKK